MQEEAGTPGGLPTGWLVTAIALLALVVGYGVAVAWTSSGDVARGTVVRGVAIGGLTHEAAVMKLRAQLGPASERAVRLKVQEEEILLDPAEAGMAVDWDATVRKASGPVVQPIALYRHMTGEVAVEQVRTVDRPQLDAALAALAAEVDRQPEEPHIDFTSNARARLDPGQIGARVEVGPAAERIAAAYLLAPVVAVPVTSLPPAVSEASASKTYSDLAVPAVKAPVVVLAGKQRLTLSPQAIAKSLSFQIQGRALVPTLDGGALRKQIAGQLSAYETGPQDARIVISGGRPVVISSKKGRSIKAADLATAVMSVLPAGKDREAAVTVTAVKPAFTTKQAKDLGIKEQLSTFWQPFPPAAYRYQNVGRAAAYLNGTLLKPGETFSMNDTIHERTQANGYTKGFIISGGRFREEQGGGVSIITTATWTAGFYAGLERVESHPHGLYIDRYKAGLEATVAWGYLDLKMRNDTGHGVLITAQRLSNGVRVSFWGTKKYDEVRATFSPRHSYTAYQTIRDSGARCVPSSGIQGFRISVTRHLINDGKTVARQTWPTTYKPTPHVICG